MSDSDTSQTSQLEAPRFAREVQRHRLAPRTATVIEVGSPATDVARITFSGADFHDFASTGPADHVKLLFPDPTTGILSAPSIQADGSIVRPDAPLISRDYTPLNVRLDGAAGIGTFDVDFMLHENQGPATAWAASAKVGDTIVAMGPKGSRAAPHDIDGILLVADATALPSVSRWIGDVDDSVSITLVASVDNDAEWVRHYLGDALTGKEVTIIRVDTNGDAVLAAVQALGPIGSGTFVFGGAESTSLIPFRKHLKYTLELPREQFALSGYWRRGTVALNHHAPIDETDPD